MVKTGNLTLDETMRLGAVTMDETVGDFMTGEMRTGGDRM